MNPVVRASEPIRSPAPVAGGLRLSAFTVDVEDWYQSCIDLDAPISERVVRNVDRLLEVLDSFGVKGTFFVQGRVAETFPRMLEDLVEQGHEVQSHGHSHRSLSAMSRPELRDELERARATVEDACGRRVTSFRAPDFSIGAANLWALESLAEAGFTVDSSIFPTRSRHYGIAGWELAPHRLTLGSGARLLEVPVAVWRAGRLRVPVAGGGYFRLLPRRILERGLRGIIADGRPAIVYCHPYEFSPNELDAFRGVIPAATRVSQAMGREKFVVRLRELFAAMPFGRFDEVLRGWRLT